MECLFSITEPAGQLLLPEVRAQPWLCSAYQQEAQDHKEEEMQSPGWPH